MEQHERLCHLLNYMKHGMVSIPWSGEGRDRENQNDDNAENVNTTN